MDASWAWASTVVAAGLWLLSANLSVAGPVASVDAQAVFEARKDALLKEGVHRAEGFVFASRRLRVSDSDEVALDKAQMRAVRDLLEFRIGEQINNSFSSDGLRQAALEVAVSCVGGPKKFTGLASVYDDKGDGWVQVVEAVPASTLDAITLNRDTLASCLRGRVESKRASILEAIVLREIEGDSSEGPGGGDNRLLRALGRQLGRGVRDELSGRWLDDNGELCAPCLAGWTGPAEQSVLKTGSIGIALSPLPEDMLARLSMEDLFTLLSSRVHDPAVKAALVDRLRSSGFVRTANALHFPALGLKSIEDHPGKHLDRQLRAKVVSVPVVAAILLSDGRLEGEWSAVEQPWYGSAVAAFDEGTPDSLSRAITLLAENVQTVPNVEAVSLLSAALISADEPYLAEPLARAAFFAQPSHKFAGVNALRAAKALGLRERAAELYPRVIAEAKVGEWGKGELITVAEWLGVPAPTWVSTDQSTKPVASDPVRTSPEGMDP